MRGSGAATLAHFSLARRQRRRSSPAQFVLTNSGPRYSPTTQLVPIFLALALYGGTQRAFRFEPCLAGAARVRRIDPLRHGPLETPSAVGVVAPLVLRQRPGRPVRRPAGGAALQEACVGRRRTLTRHHTELQPPAPGMSSCWRSSASQQAAVRGRLSSVRISSPQTT